MSTDPSRCKSCGRPKGTYAENKPQDEDFCSINCQQNYLIKAKDIVKQADPWARK